ncbi:MAG: NAD-dependent malic enzyme [Actinomycetota bacterium]|nr:NAD-dependent malic enzyme [Actinomycetota bacterium]
MEPRPLDTALRGRQLLSDPRLTHGVAFTPEERRTFGLVGLLPPGVLPLDVQAARAYQQFSAQQSDLAKHVFLTLLHERIEVLYFRLLQDHLAEMLPIVYTPTVGEAIQRFSAEFRGTRGVYLSVDHAEDIEQSLAASGLGPDDVDVVVATDGEAILGIGDWGVGGIAISIGKLAVYTAAGGIDPDRTLPVVLDVGTNRQTLLDDPLYLGNRHPRVDVSTYDDFIDAYVRTAGRLFPRALLHWEDLGASNARRVLDRYKDDRLTFNDDIQGTGAIVLAAVLSALRTTGGRLEDQRVVIHGAGSAGIGIAEQLAAAIAEDGASDGRGAIWALSSRGLLRASTGRLRDFQRPFARPEEEVRSFEKDSDGRIGLAEVVRQVRPTILIGTSGQPGSFTEEIVRTMAAHCERPIVMPLSNPTSLSEAEPADLLSWTQGRALVASGSPFSPVTIGAETFAVAQANNALVFPGLGLGVIVARASRVTPRMLHAAARAVAGEVDASSAGAPLLPPVDTLRQTSAAVAAAVAQAAAEDGVAGVDRIGFDDAVAAAMWEPAYRPLRPVPPAR